MLLYQWHQRSDTVSSMTSYWFQSYVIGCHSVQVLSTTVGCSLVVKAMVTDLCCHLTYNSRGAWHTVYAMLLSKYNWDSTRNSYNWKEWFSQIYNAFSNNFILCYLCVSATGSPAGMQSRSHINIGHNAPMQNLVGLLYYLISDEKWNNVTTWEFYILW